MVPLVAAIVTAVLSIGVTLLAPETTADATTTCTLLE
jgi:hypothetical protein